MNLDLLEELCQTAGGPGREERIREIVIRELEPLVDDIQVDRMGNVIARRAPRGKTKPKNPRKMMLSAHMDEISLMVTHIEDSGFLRFTTLGGFDPKTLAAQRVIVHGRKDVIGLIGTKPAHIMSDAEKKQMPSLDSFFIDLGMPKARVEKIVRIGDLCTRERDFVEVGDSVSTKSLDDRVGVFVMIEAVRKLTSHAVEVYAVATTQEEIGIRGAQVAAQSLQPDMGVALDVTLANDVPGAGGRKQITELGKGTAIKIMDSSVVCDFRIVDGLRAVAEKKKIPYQMEVLPKGGTDTAAIQRNGGGAPAGCISIPCRYVHSVIEMCHKKDIEGSINLLAAFLADAHNVPLDFD
ncbi:MAG: M42 family metallopeptidase [Gemmatimonadetes bacterium]|nr:M42 family metallopeptidase [Gemmatimonadota bacterium]